MTVMSSTRLNSSVLFTSTHRSTRSPDCSRYISTDLDDQLFTTTIYLVQLRGQTVTMALNRGTYQVWSAASTSGSQNNLRQSSSFTTALATTTIHSVNNLTVSSLTSHSVLICRSLTVVSGKKWPFPLPKIQLADLGSAVSSPRVIQDGAPTNNAFVWHLELLFVWQ